MYMKIKKEMYIYIYISRIYTGKLAQVSITDLELVKKVTLKDSANFINREVTGFN